MKACEVWSVIWARGAKVDIEILGPNEEGEKITLNDFRWVSN